jgi:hypothetical protein
VIDEEIEYVVVAKFQAQFPGFCTIERSHKVKRGDWVSKVQFADNPMVPIQGVACKRCTEELPRANV